LGPNRGGFSSWTVRATQAAPGEERWGWEAPEGRKGIREVETRTGEKGVAKGEGKLPRSRSRKYKAKTKNRRKHAPEARVITSVLDWKKEKG